MVRKLNELKPSINKKDLDDSFKEYKLRAQRLRKFHVLQEKKKPTFKSKVFEV